MHGWDIPNFNSEFPAFAKVSISAGIVFFAVATGPLQNKDAYQVTFSLCLDVLPIDEKPTGKSKYHHNDHHSHPGLHKSSTSRRIVRSGLAAPLPELNQQCLILHKEKGRHEWRLAASVNYPTEQSLIVRQQKPRR
jgi:hypothetical protein